MGNEGNKKLYQHLYFFLLGFIKSNIFIHHLSLGGLFTDFLSKCALKDNWSVSPLNKLRTEA